jgi:hypothetical protein
MIYFLETIIQWSTMLWWIFTLLLIDARWHLLCAWSLEAVVGSSSLLPDILLCLLTSPVRTQLTLIGPHWGPWPPGPQSGVPSPRVHSLSRVQNSINVQIFNVREEILIVKFEQPERASQKSDAIKQIYWFIYSYTAVYVFWVSPWPHIPVFPPDLFFVCILNRQGGTEFF